MIVENAFFVLFYPPPPTPPPPKKPEVISSVTQNFKIFQESWPQTLLGWLASSDAACHDLLDTCGNFC